MSSTPVADAVTNNSSFNNQTQSTLTELETQGSVRDHSFWRLRGQQASGSASLEQEQMQAVVAGLRSSYANDVYAGTIEQNLQERGYDPYKYSTGYIPPADSLPRDAAGNITWGEVVAPDDASQSYKAYVEYMNSQAKLLEQLRDGEISQGEYNTLNALAARDSGFANVAHFGIDIDDHYGLPMWVDTPEGRVFKLSPSGNTTYGYDSGIDLSQWGIVGEKNDFEQWGAKKLWESVKHCDREINMLRESIETGVDKYGRTVTPELRAAFEEQISQFESTREETWQRLIHSNMDGLHIVQRKAPFRGHIPEDILREMENYDASKNTYSDSTRDLYRSAIARIEKFRNSARESS